MRSIYSIKLEFLLDFRIRIERVNLFELKLNLSITLQIIDIIYINCSFFTNLKVKEQKFLNLYIIIYNANTIRLLIKKYTLIFSLFIYYSLKY